MKKKIISKKIKDEKTSLNIETHLSGCLYSSVKESPNRRKCEDDLNKTKRKKIN